MRRSNSIECAKINFALGLIGWLIVGLIGGFVLGLFFNGSTGIILSIVVAFIGACLLTWIVRTVTGSRSPL